MANIQQLRIQNKQTAKSLKTWKNVHRQKLGGSAPWAPALLGESCTEQEGVPICCFTKRKKKQKTPEDLQLRKGDFKVIHTFNAVHDSSLKSIVLDTSQLTLCILSDWYFMTQAQIVAFEYIEGCSGCASMLVLLRPGWPWYGIAAFRSVLEGRGGWSSDVFLTLPFPFLHVLTFYLFPPLPRFFFFSFCSLQPKRGQQNLPIGSAC